MAKYEYSNNMISSSGLRPWGRLDWLLSKVTPRKWSFYGCLATEKRSTTAFKSLMAKDILDTSVFLEIVDTNDTDIHGQLREEHKDQITLLDKNTIIETHRLIQPLDTLNRSVKSFLARSSKSIILDISCFPKRFFFPIIKFFFQNNEIEDLLICYTSPEIYSEENLSDNPQPWMTLPGFNAEEDGTESAIIGVGFMPLGLPDVLNGDGNKKSINIFFPFPPGPPFYQRTWNFVREISKFRPIHPKELIRIDAMNVPDAFDKICAITDGGEKKVLFAPFGPKTFSLAMCLHACQTESSVYYTQPMSYNPYYSKGEGEIFGYSIILNKKNLYLL